MGPARAAMLRRASSRGWPAGKKSNGSRGPRCSAVRGETTGCLRRQRGRKGTQPGGATRRLEPEGRQTLGGGSEAGPAPRRHSLARARSRSGTSRAHAAGAWPVSDVCRRRSAMEWNHCNGMEWSGGKARSQAPKGAAQCRDAGSNSSRVWAAGKTSNPSLPSAAGGRSECSAGDWPTGGAGREQAADTRPGFKRAAQRRVPPNLSA